MLSSLEQGMDVLKFNVPCSKRLRGDHAFSVAAPQLWNHLPYEIRAAPSVNIFKSLLKTSFFPVVITLSCAEWRNTNVMIDWLILERNEIHISCSYIMYMSRLSFLSFQAPKEFRGRGSPERSLTSHSLRKLSHCHYSCHYHNIHLDWYIKPALSSERTCGVNLIWQA